VHNMNWGATMCT